MLLVQWHGYFISSSLHFQVNLAARCQAVGKFPDVKELSQTELSSDDDRVLCTITSDMATFDSNTMMADPNTAHPSSISPKIVSLATENICRYERRLVEGVTLQGIGSTNVAITFITKQKALEKLHIR